MKNQADDLTQSKSLQTKQTNKTVLNVNRSLNDTMSLVAVEFVFAAPLSVCLSSSEKSLTSTKFELATKC